MSFENIQLSPSLIQDLYKDVLIVENDRPLNSIALKEPRNGYLEKNEKNIQVLINEADSPYLSDEDLNFLTGILNACRLSIADVAIVNIHHNNALNHKTLTGKFSSK